MECSDENHLDLLCMPSNIDVYGHNHCTVVGAENEEVVTLQFCVLSGIWGVRV